MKIYYTSEEIIELSKSDLKCVICKSYYQLDRDFDTEEVEYSFDDPYHLNCNNNCGSINFWFEHQKSKYILSWHFQLNKISKNDNKIQLSYVPRFIENKIILTGNKHREEFPFISFFEITESDIYSLYKKFKSIEILK